MRRTTSPIVVVGLEILLVGLRLISVGICFLFLPSRAVEEDTALQNFQTPPEKEETRSWFVLGRLKNGGSSPQAQDLCRRIDQWDASSLLEWSTSDRGNWGCQGRTSDGTWEKGGSGQLAAMRVRQLFVRTRCSLH